MRIPEHVDVLDEPARRSIKASERMNAEDVRLLLEVRMLIEIAAATLDKYRAYGTWDALHDNEMERFDGTGGGEIGNVSVQNSAGLYQNDGSILTTALVCTVKQELMTAGVPNQRGGQSTGSNESLTI